MVLMVLMMLGTAGWSLSNLQCDDETGESAAAEGLKSEDCMRSSVGFLLKIS